MAAPAGEVGGRVVDLVPVDDEPREVSGPAVAAAGEQEAGRGGPELVDCHACFECDGQAARLVVARELGHGDCATAVIADPPRTAVW